LRRFSALRHLGQRPWHSNQRVYDLNPDKGWQVRIRVDVIINILGNFDHFSVISTIFSDHFSAISTTFWQFRPFFDHFLRILIIYQRDIAIFDHLSTIFVDLCINFDKENWRGYI
jgi:hypothetical protein